MDNLKTHKVAGIHEAIAAAHTTLRYLLPYSPQLSAIELDWSKIKSHLCAQAARTQDALALAWTQALASFTSSDARHWFAHCGYRTAPN